MKTALKHSGRTAAGIPAAALIVRLGMSAIVVVASLTVFAVIVICWIISSDERSDRVNRMMLARRGDARCLKGGPGGPPQRTVPTKAGLSEITGRYL
jgi:hypothetical protein